MNRRTFNIWLASAIAGVRAGLAENPNPKGYSVRSEESPHARTWMCWPSRPKIYGGPGQEYERVRSALAHLAREIAKFEPVTMLAAATHHQTITRLCGPAVEVLDIPTDDMWARDSGPVFVTHPEYGLAAVDFHFNGWGGRQQHRLDRKISAAVARHLGCALLNAEVVGEGGGLEYDGEGTLLLTDSCWVNENRNPGSTREEIETALRSALGVHKVIWLPGVRGQDITDGHIDGSIRIVRPGLLMTGGYPGDTSEWGRALAESKAILSKSTDAKGRPFEMVDIPSAVDVRSDHPDFFSGYANYYVANGAVFTPTFGDSAADAHARETLGRLYPKRKIVSLEVDPIYENGGGIHCVTQQQPRVG